MLKVLVAAFALLAVSPSAAQEVAAKTVERWWNAHYLCRMGETRDGTPTTKQESDESCRERETLTNVLEKDHYCWSKSEQEWYPIGQDDGLCQQAN